ncbi:MAG: hypothetical protein GX786_08775 [Clostridiales bacterium]|nr:hypothetical protein [Clostridiales bacterium]
MRKKLEKKFLLVFTLLVTIVVGFGASVLAGPAYQVDVVLPVTQELIVKNPKETPPTKVFTYVMTGKTGQEPMPKVAPGNEYSFSIEGTAVINLPAIRFIRPGVYSYKLLQQVAEPLAYYTYDWQQYSVDIHVANDGAGGLNSLIVIKGKEAKADKIKFTNIFDKPSPTPVPTINPDTTPTSRPGEKPPKAGDETNLLQWILLGAGAVLLLVLALVMYSKHKKKKD